MFHFMKLDTHISPLSPNVDTPTEFTEASASAFEVSSPPPGVATGTTTVPTTVYIRPATAYAKKLIAQEMQTYVQLPDQVKVGMTEIMERFAGSNVWQRQLDSADKAPSRALTRDHKAQLKLVAELALIALTGQAWDEHGQVITFSPESVTIVRNTLRDLITSSVDLDVARSKKTGRSSYVVANNQIVLSKTITDHPEGLEDVLNLVHLMSHAEVRQNNDAMKPYIRKLREGLDIERFEQGDITLLTEYNARFGQSYLMTDQETDSSHTEILQRALNTIREHYPAVQSWLEDEPEAAAAFDRALMLLDEGFVLTPDELELILVGAGYLKDFFDLDLVEMPGETHAPYASAPLAPLSK